MTSSYVEGTVFVDEWINLLSMSTPSTGISSGNRPAAALTSLQRFNFIYGRYHGFLSVIVCVIGIISSVFIVAVLTRRHMVSSTNYMLTALAVCDTLKMIVYVPFAVQYYCRYGVHPSATRDSLAWARFCLVYANVSVVAHTSSIWIAVALSAYRYSVVRRSTDSRATSGSSAGEIRTSRFIVGVVCFSSFIALLPNYLTLTISEQLDFRSNRTMFLVMSTFDLKDASDFDHVVGQLNFWVQALIVKLVPCVLMLVFGWLLVTTVRRHSLNRKQLRQTCNRGVGKEKTGRKSLGSAVTCVSGGISALPRTGSGGPRTTAMLVSVIVLFLITELPHGVLTLVCGVHREYFDTLYSPLGDLMDMVALVNNAINFVLYCTMSRQFRMTFWQLISTTRFPMTKQTTLMSSRKHCLAMEATVVKEGEVVIQYSPELKARCSN